MVSPAEPFSIATTAGRQAQSPEPKADDDPDEDPLPFSVELGPARPFAKGFAVPGLRVEKGATHAFVALVSSEGGRLAELGAVHGDPEPPLVASRGERLFALVFDSDAAGRVVRVGEIVEPQKAPSFRALAEIGALGRDAAGFTAEIGERRGLIAYTAASAGKNTLFLVSFDPAAREQKLTAKPLPGIEAEEPRLAVRPGGFWLAFVQEFGSGALPAAPKSRPDAGDDVGLADLIELAPSELRLSPLDESGELAGASRALTPRMTKPFSFDLVSGGAGGALLLWQQAHGAPGADGGKIELIDARPDGTLDRRWIEDDRLGAGVPVLLRDPEPKSAATALWLTAAGNDDSTLFTVLGPEPPKLEGDPAIRGGAILAVRNGRFLVSQPRGRNVELSEVECTPPLPAAPR